MSELTFRSVAGMVAGAALVLTVAGGTAAYAADTTTPTDPTTTQTTTVTPTPPPPVDPDGHGWVD